MRYYNIEQIAHILGIDTERVRQLILTEELPSLDYEHVSEKDLINYIREGGI